MSKLADAIRRSLQTEPNAIGFGAARSAPRPTMLVALLAPKGDASAGQVVILDGRRQEVATGDVAAARSANPSAVVGAWPAEPTPARVAELAKAGSDFIVFEPESTPAASLLDEELGYVIAMPDETDEAFLRSLDPLSLDAALLSRVPSPLTVSKQLELARNSILSRKPLACTVSPDISSEELECLRGAGVILLVTTEPEGVAALVETVAKLPPRRRRREERRTVSLPRHVPGVEEDEEEEDDE